MPNNSINCVVTSPPYYGLRDYNNDNQLGQEDTPEKYIERLVMIFGEIKRVLRPDGTVWLNLGDSYWGSGGVSGQSPEALNLGKTRAERIYASEGITRNLKSDYLKPKDLIGIPWRVAFALQANGWYLRQDIIWHKPNPMPESVKDRCTKAHEYIFLLTKSKKYFYDYKAIQEPIKDVSIARAFRGLSEENKWNEGAPGSTAHSISKPRPNVPKGERKKFKPSEGGGGSGLKGHSGYYDAAGKIIGNGMANKKSVWTVPTKAFKDAHFAVFPEELIKPCVLAGCPEGGVVYDPFFGAGTTGQVAMTCYRKFIGSELNPEYVEIAYKRLKTLLTQTRLEI